MIRVHRIFGKVFMTGSDYELEQARKLDYATLKSGDKITVLPKFHHVHRNPIRKPIIKFIEDQNLAGEGEPLKLCTTRGKEDSNV